MSRNVQQMPAPTSIFSVYRRYGVDVVRVWCGCGAGVAWVWRIRRFKCHQAVRIRSARCLDLAACSRHDAHIHASALPDQDPGLPAKQDPAKGNAV
jgi:hypothetical protein